MRIRQITEGRDVATSAGGSLAKYAVTPNTKDLLLQTLRSNQMPCRGSYTTITVGPCMILLRQSHSRQASSRPIGRLTSLHFMSWHLDSCQWWRDSCSRHALQYTVVSVSVRSAQLHLSVTPCVHHWWPTRYIKLGRNWTLWPAAIVTTMHGVSVTGRK